MPQDDAIMVSARHSLDSTDSTPDFSGTRFFAHHWPRLARRVPRTALADRSAPRTERPHRAPYLREPPGDRARAALARVGVHDEVRRLHSLPVRLPGTGGRDALEQSAAYQEKIDAKHKPSSRAAWPTRRSRYETDSDCTRAPISAVISVIRLTGSAKRSRQRRTRPSHASPPIRAPSRSDPAARMCIFLGGR